MAVDGMAPGAVDRNTDVVLLAGLSDKALASKTLDHARELRWAAALTERDGPLGEVLNRIVPTMAHKLGVSIDDHEHRVILEHGEKMRMRGETPRETVETLSRTIMHSLHPGRKQFPESALFTAPEKGNLAAVMLDRVLTQEGIPQSTRRDGGLDVFPGPKGQTDGIAGVHGPEAVGTHAIATHMLEKTAEVGHHPMPYWSPGHLMPPRDGGKFSDLLSKESLLEINDKAVYAERISRLPNADLAAELVEQAREMRERRPELAYEECGYHRYMTWHGIPAMGALFGQTVQPKEVETHPVKTENDQQAFDSMSSATLHGIGEGQSYVLRNTQRDDNHERPTLAEKVMFNEPTHGSSMGMLLDRVAVELDVERGQEFDRMGKAIAEVTRFRGDAVSHAWIAPKTDRSEEVSLRAERSMEASRASQAPEPDVRSGGPAKGAMAAALAAAGLGRG